MRRLSYYRARYYDPTTGRFLSEDPTGFVAGLNFYAYVFNNPMINVDPEGLDCQTVGSYTWCKNQTYDWQKQAEDAHESAHRDAGLSRQLDPRACPDLEAEAFRREVSSGAYQKRLKELYSKKCLTDSEKKEQAEIQERLLAAQDNSNRKTAVDYCKSNNRLWKKWIK